MAKYIIQRRMRHNMKKLNKILVLMLVALIAIFNNRFQKANAEDPDDNLHRSTTLIQECESPFTTEYFNQILTVICCFYGVKSFRNSIRSSEEGVEARIDALKHIFSIMDRGEALNRSLIEEILLDGNLSDFKSIIKLLASIGKNIYISFINVTRTDHRLSIAENVTEYLNENTNGITVAVSVSDLENTDYDLVNYNTIIDPNTHKIFNLTSVCRYTRSGFVSAFVKHSNNQWYKNTNQVSTAVLEEEVMTVLRNSSEYVLSYSVM